MTTTRTWTVHWKRDDSPTKERTFTDGSLAEAFAEALRVSGATAYIDFREATR